MFNCGDFHAFRDESVQRLFPGDHLDLGRWSIFLGEGYSTSVPTIPLKWAIVPKTAKSELFVPSSGASRRVGRPDATMEKPPLLTIAPKIHFGRRWRLVFCAGPAWLVHLVPVEL